MNTNESENQWKKNTHKIVYLGCARAQIYMVSERMFHCVYLLLVLL